MFPSRHDRRPRQPEPPPRDPNIPPEPHEPSLLLPNTRREAAFTFSLLALSWVALLSLCSYMIPHLPRMGHAEPPPPPTTRMRRLMQKGEYPSTWDQVQANIEQQTKAFVNMEPAPDLTHQLNMKLQERDGNLPDVFYPFNLSGSYRGTGFLNYTAGENTTNPTLPSSTVLRIRTFLIPNEERYHQAQIRVMLTPDPPNDTMTVMIQANGLYDTTTGHMQAVSSGEAESPELPKFETVNLTYPDREWPVSSKGHFQPTECPFLVDVEPDSITEDLHKREMAGTEEQRRNGGQKNNSHHLRARSGAYSAIMDREYIDVHVQATVRSLNHTCTNVTEAQTSADLLRYDLFILKATKYALIATCLSFIQLLLLFRQMQFSTPANAAQKLSLTSIAMHSVFDAYLCLIHLTTGLYIDDLFNSFIMVSFLQFMVFSMFDLRLVLLVWRARHPLDFSTGWETMRSTLTKIYSGFYGGVFVCLIFYYYVRHHMSHFIFLLFSFWVPQIVRNVRTGERFALQERFVFGVTAIRLFFPLYAFGCPENFLEFPTNVVVVVLLLLYAGIQVLVLKGQDKLGSRFFIPKRFQPDYYEYHRTFQADPDDEECCAICMTDFSSLDGTDSKDLKKKVLTTPCNHRFCRECLTRWMETKMVCPTCRQPLPPYT